MVAQILNKYKLRSSDLNEQAKVYKLLSKIPEEYQDLLTGTWYDLPILLFFALATDWLGKERKVEDDMDSSDTSVLKMLRFAIPPIFPLPGEGGLDFYAQAHPREKIYFNLDIKRSMVYEMQDKKCSELYFGGDNGEGGWNFFEIFVRNKKVEWEWIKPTNPIELLDGGYVGTPFNNQMFVRAVSTVAYRQLHILTELIDFRVD